MYLKAYKLVLIPGFGVMKLIKNTSHSTVSISSNLCGWIFRQIKDGSLLVSRISVFSFRKFSPGPKDQGQRFQEASAYARRAAHMHPVYTELAKAMKLSPYNIALSDRMNPPVIHRILYRNDRIFVEASDNVMVAKVEIMILDEQGEILEQGEAVRVQGDWWEYLPECTGKNITAAAWDLAGNVTKVEL